MEVKVKKRRSCDRCTTKKVKCDGMPACNNCIVRGYLCSYSFRKVRLQILEALCSCFQFPKVATHDMTIVLQKKTGPRLRTARDEHPELVGLVNAQGLVPYITPTSSNIVKDETTEAPPALRSSPGLVDPHHTLSSSGTTVLNTGGLTSMYHHYYPMTTPFSANPLTQHYPLPLLSSMEAQYLEAYLAEVNVFLPMVDEASVRGNLNRVLQGEALPMISTIPANPHLPQETAESLRRVQLINAENCILWSAIAIGSLLAGNFDVTKYTSLAWISMKECFDLGVPTTVSAYLLMSVLYMMLGDDHYYRRYLFMGDDLAREMGTTLSMEAEIVLRYLRVGQKNDLKLMEKQLQDVEELEPPSENPHLLMLHLLTHIKIYLLHNRNLNEHNERVGKPRTPINFEAIFAEMERANDLLLAGPASSCSVGFCFTRGLLAILTYVKSQGKELPQVLEMILPLTEHLARVPGIQRIMPLFHFVHSFAMLFLEAGNVHMYESLQRSQAGVQWGDAPQLPPLGTVLEGFCDHPVCDTISKISLQGRRKHVPSSRQSPRKNVPSQEEVDLSSASEDWNSENSSTKDLEHMVEEVFGDLSSEQLDQLGQIFGNPDFPSHMVF